VIDLNQFVRSSDMGDFIKTTTQKFYRINGGSTQLEGVSSDIIMPDRYAYLKDGERDVDHAIWDKLTLPPIHFGIKQPLIKPFQIVKRELLIMINLN
jgi:carboxyl-terminal processing protease